MIDYELKPYPGEDKVSFAKRNAYYYRFLKARFQTGALMFPIIKDMGNMCAISAAEKERIDEFWSRYLTPEQRDTLINYTYYDIYKKHMASNEDLALYIPNSFYYSFIDDYFTNPQDSFATDDKNLYDVFFHDVNRPTTVFHKTKSLFLDKDYCQITQAEAVKKARDCGEVILKKCKFSMGGHDIMFWNAETDDESKLMGFLHDTDMVLCQELIKQHEDTARVNPSSVNTVRIMTLIFQEQVHVLSRVFRMGVDGSRVDNASSGGIVCGVKPNGQLKNVAYDTKANRYPCHPQGTVFESVTIPNFDECISMATQLAQRFSSVSRLISWDIAIDQSGHPSLIECNLTYGELDFHQYCNGPIFGDLTDDVLKEVFANSYTLKSIIKSFQ